MRTLRKHWSYILRVRRDLLALLAVSVAAYIGIEIASAWPASSYWVWRVGQGFSVLAMAYVTAFIFYYFVNHIQEEGDREVLSQLALPHLKNLQTGNDAILGNVLRKEFFKTERLSFDEIKAIVKGIDLDQHYEYGSADAPQEDTVRDLLEMWYEIAHRGINEILSHGLKIDSEVLSLLHVLREHTERDFESVKGKLELDNNTVTRYRIVETVYFTNLLIKWMRRYPPTVLVRDKEYSDAMKRNMDRLQEEIIETARLRNEGKIIFEEDLREDHPIRVELRRQDSASGVPRL